MSAVGVETVHEQSGNTNEKATIMNNDIITLEHIYLETVIK